jgi:hypothetical protein
MSYRAPVSQPGPQSYGIDSTHSGREVPLLRGTNTSNVRFASCEANVNKNHIADSTALVSFEQPVGMMQ